MMTSQLLGVKDTPGLMTERNYLGLSDCSSVDSSNVSGLSEVNKSSLGLKATELRLGLPGSRSPDRDPESSLTSSDKLEEKPLFHFLPSSPKMVVSGHKRVFTDTMDSCSEVKGLSDGNWMFGGSAMESDSLKSLGQGKFSSNSNVNGIALSEASKMAQVTSGTKLNKVNSSNTPAAKAQVVGWPPVRSFRKNILATSSKNNDEVDGKPGPGALFVKVSMDGAPYLRKVDLRGYSTYQQLSSALEKMFSCFTIGQCGSQGGSGRVSLSESKLRDLLHGSEYVLTYEDKDGDWMLVGDVPWDMFISSCKRLKIMKGSDAIGLGVTPYTFISSIQSSSAVGKHQFFLVTHLAYIVGSPGNRKIKEQKLALTTAWSDSKRPVFVWMESCRGNVIRGLYCCLQLCSWL